MHNSVPHTSRYCCCTTSRLLQGLHSSLVPLSQYAINALIVENSHCTSYVHDIDFVAVSQFSCCFFLRAILVAFSFNFSLVNVGLPSSTIVIPTSLHQLICSRKKDHWGLFINTEFLLWMDIPLCVYRIRVNIDHRPSHVLGSIVSVSRSYIAAKLKLTSKHYIVLITTSHIIIAVCKLPFSGRLKTMIFGCYCKLYFYPEWSLFLEHVTY